MRSLPVTDVHAKRSKLSRMFYRETELIDIALWQRSLQPCLPAFRWPTKDASPSQELVDVRANAKPSSAGGFPIRHPLYIDYIRKADQKWQESQPNRAPVVLLAILFQEGSDWSRNNWRGSSPSMELWLFATFVQVHWLFFLHLGVPNATSTKHGRPRWI